MEHNLPKVTGLISFSARLFHCLDNLAENRVSLSIFNYHTWIEYDIADFLILFRAILIFVMIQAYLMQSQRS